MNKNNYDCERDKKRRYKCNVDMIEKFVEYKKKLEFEGRTKTKKYIQVKETDKKLEDILQHSESDLYETYLFAKNSNHIPMID